MRALRVTPYPKTTALHLVDITRTVYPELACGSGVPRRWQAPARAAGELCRCGAGLAVG